MTHDCPPSTGIAKVADELDRPVVSIMGGTSITLKKISSVPRRVIDVPPIIDTTGRIMGGTSITLKKISSVPRRVSVHTITALSGVMAIPERSPRFAVKSRNRFFLESFEETVVRRRFSNEFSLQT